MSTVKLQKSLAGVALATVLLLAVPAIAMQFDAQFAWGPGDFLLAAVLLFGAGSLIVLGLGFVTGAGRRAALVGGVALALAVVWAELAAVGLFH